MNAASEERLFREEALRRRDGRLQGDVHLAVPLSWRLIGFSLFAIVGSAFAFLALASFERVETVRGVVALDKGTAAVMSLRPGVVAQVHVREGEAVAAGTPLMRIRVEEDMPTGSSAAARTLVALREQDARLEAQQGALLQAGGADQARISEEMRGIERELASLRSQIESQQRLVDVAAQELADVRGVAERGFISRRDVNAREGALLTRRQQLAQLQQALAARAADHAEGRRARLQAAASAQAQALGLQSSRSALTQQAAQADASRGYLLTAPVAGTVTALVARPGQPAAADRPLAVIVPRGAAPYVELHVPTSAAGFLERGQAVRLAIDAFPYQRFGTIEATIEHVSAVTVPNHDAQGNVVPTYLVAARLSRPFVMASGRPQRVLPGMTLTARIVTDRRTLLQWLFEPLFTAGAT